MTTTVVVMVVAVRRTCCMAHGAHVLHAARRCANVACCMRVAYCPRAQNQLYIGSSDTGIDVLLSEAPRREFKFWVVRTYHR